MDMKRKILKFLQVFLILFFFFLHKSKKAFWFPSTSLNFLAFFLHFHFKWSWKTKTLFGFHRENTWSLNHLVKIWPTFLLMLFNWYLRQIQWNAIMSIHGHLTLSSCCINSLLFLLSFPWHLEMPHLHFFF